VGIVFFALEASSACALFVHDCCLMMSLSIDPNTVGSSNCATSPA